MKKRRNLLTIYGGGYSYLDIVQEVFMKRTIIAVISIVLIAFAFTACRQSVVIPFDPMPGPNTPSEPSVPDYTIQVGDKTYQHLDEAIAAAPENGTINIGAGRFVIPSTLSFKNLTINGAGMDETIIEVNGSWGFNVTGSSTTISNLTIADASGTASRLLNVQASQILIDHVRLEGKYNSNSSGATNSGILADSNVTDITVKNSEFKGIRMPLNIDLENAENPKVTISENVFDTFLKLAFTTNIDLLDISSDNTFNPVDAEYHIELFNKGDLTAERAIEVAATTGLVVQAELGDGKFYFDAEGAVISTVEHLKAFAAGNAGTTAKLVNEDAIKITSSIRFTANGLTLNADNKSIESTVPIIIMGTGITINDADVSYTGTSGSVLIKNQGERTTISGGKFTGIYETEASAKFNGITSTKPITVTGASFTKFRMPVYPDGETAGSVIQDNKFDTCFKVEVKADELDSITLINNTFANGLASSDIVITGDATEDIAKSVSEANYDCKVAYGESSIYPEA